MRLASIQIDSPPRQRRGFVLVGVLIVVLLASMLVMTLLFGMQGEEAAASAVRSTDQSWLACMSGVEQALRVAAAAVPGSTDWRDNPGAFRKKLVFEDGAERWYFTIYSKADEDSPEPIRYGLTDEASKLNLNTTTREMLAKVPDLTAELLDAMENPGSGVSSLTSIAAPATTNSFAASEFDFPSGRKFQTLAGLLAVNGFTPRLVFGEDANFNLLLDANEDDGDARPPLDNSDHRLDLGLSAFLTVSTRDGNRNNAGQARVNIHDELAVLPKDLPPPLAAFIEALRKNKARLGHAADLLEARLTMKDENGAESQMASEVGKEELPAVLDLLTASSQSKQEGLVNVNTASIKVLAALPGMDEPLAESIASTRRSLGPDRKTTTAWLFQEGALTAAQFKALAPHICARGFQYSFHVIGFSLPSGKYRALEVTIDTDGRKTVTSLRDLTRFGLPISLEEETDQENTNA